MTMTMVVHTGIDGAPRSATAICRDLARAHKALGASATVLLAGTGWNVPDLPAIVGVGARIGLRIGLATEEPAVLRCAAETLLPSFGSVLGAVRCVLPTGGTADRHILWPELEALLSCKEARVEVALFVTTKAVASLEEMTRKVATTPRKAHLTLRYLAPGPLADRRLFPPLDQVAKALDGALRAARAFSAAAFFEGFPPCVVADKQRSCLDEGLRLSPSRRPLTEVADLQWLAPSEVQKTRRHLLPCTGCVDHQRRCPGVASPYVAAAAASEGSALNPRRGVLSNSYNYEHLPEDRWLHPAEVSAHPARYLFLSSGQERTCYETPTSDFSDSHLDEVKELEQVYLDLSEQGAPDFAAPSDLRRLRLEKSCVLCPLRTTCPRSFVLDSVPPFQREERWIRKELSRMRGRVLDAGCGQSLYTEELGQLIKDEHIDYHGLDPREDLLQQTERELSGGTFYPTTLEAFEPEPGYFDYALLLRSVNHLADPPRAMETITRALRPGGQLVVCDSPVYALARTAHQVLGADSRARSAAGPDRRCGHEHYRNWTSQSLVELLGDYPFRVDIHRPVSAQTSNLWIVKLMRTGGLATP